MNILVTGAFGYLGTHLVGRLLLANHDVIALDSGREATGTLNQWCFCSQLEIVRGDCRDLSIIAQLIRKADVIIPLAALVGVDRCESDKTAAQSTNFAAIWELNRIASKSQRIIFPCTNSGYGIGGDGICTEESPMKPISIYGKTKAEAETHIMQRENSISFRFATLFGMSPRMRWNLLVNDFVRRSVLDRSLVLFEPEFKRNYLHVRDGANAILFAIEHWDAMKGSVYNAGLSSANLSKRELAEKIKTHVPDLHILEAPLGVDPDRRNYQVSNAKLEATGWKPQYSLDEGIVELIKGVYAN